MLCITLVRFKAECMWKVSNCWLSSYYYHWRDPEEYWEMRRKDQGKEVLLRTTEGVIDALFSPSFFEIPNRKTETQVLPELHFLTESGMGHFSAPPRKDPRIWWTLWGNIRYRSVRRQVLQATVWPFLPACSLPPLCREALKQIQTSFRNEVMLSQPYWSNRKVY